MQTVVIGDIRDIRRSAKYNQVANQKIHQMSSGQLRQMRTYKGGCKWFCKRSATRRRSAYVATDSTSPVGGSIIAEPEVGAILQPEKESFAFGRRRMSKIRRTRNCLPVSVHLPARAVWDFSPDGSGTFCPLPELNKDNWILVWVASGIRDHESWRSRIMGGAEVPAAPFREWSSDRVRH